MRSLTNWTGLRPGSPWAANANKLVNDSTRSERNYRIGIKCPAPPRGKNRQWGDYYFAQSLKRALETQGWVARVDLRPDWFSSESFRDDAVIVLRGLEKYEPLGSQINLVWVISHPDKVSDSELEAFDHVFVASESYARTLALRLNVPVSPLFQCSDPGTFYPPTTLSEPHGLDVLFVGNARGAIRPAVADAIAQNLTVSIYGHGWDKFLPPKRILGKHILNGVLHKYYAQAKIVLNDQWPDMEREGFITNRIFDVALSGGFVISKDFKGSELFEGDLVTYRTSAELAELCDTWLRADFERRRLAEKLRQRTLRSFTFLQRAIEIVAAIDALREASKRAELR